MKKTNLILTLLVVSGILIIGACSQLTSPFDRHSLGFNADYGKTGDCEEQPAIETPEPDRHFFFLPPIAPKMAFSGTFASDFEPTVRVSLVDDEELQIIGEYSSDSTGSERVRIESSEELGNFFIMNFHLKKYSIPAGSRLLFEVYGDAVKLGDFSAVVIANGFEKKTSLDDGLVPLVMNRTVPVKFRIEEELFDIPIPGRIEVWGSPNVPPELLAVPVYEDFISLAIGTRHGIGVRQDGSLVSWGSDSNGQVSGTPSGSGFVDVDAGLLYSIALHEDGTIYSWGGGLCADTDNAPAGIGFTDIAAGLGFALALNGSGEITLWSLLNYDIIGTVPTGSGYTQLGAGTDLGLAFNSFGQLELFGSTSTGLLDVDLPAGTFLQADINKYNAAGILSDGRLVSWGGDPAETRGLIQDFDDGPYRSVALGEELGVGLKKDGYLKPFGTSSVVDFIPTDRSGFVKVAANRSTAVAAISMVTD